MDKLDIDKLKILSTNLKNFKFVVDKLDLDRVQIVLVDLKKLSYIVDNDVTRKHCLINDFQNSQAQRLTVLVQRHLLINHNVIMANRIQKTRLNMLIKKY